MSSTREVNRRRSTRNRQQPQTSPPSNQIIQKKIVFVPKTKYRNSATNADGVFILSTRKRRLPMAEEIEEKKRKQFVIQVGKVSLIALRHKVINLWQHGMHTADFQFSPGSSKKIIQWMQATFPLDKAVVYGCFNSCAKIKTMSCLYTASEIIG